MSKRQPHKPTISKAKSGTKPPVNSSASTSKTSSFKFRSIFPLLGALVVLFITIVTFRNSSYSGRYDMKNTLLLYLCIYTLMAVPMIHLTGKWKKLLLFNWTAILLLFLAAEFLMRMTDWKGILNYSEKNEGYFTTNIIQYQKSLDERNKGNLLYLNLPPGNTHDIVRPEYQYRYAPDSLGLNNCKTCYSSAIGPAILTLGDSFTWGMGAPEGKAWPQVMEGILRENGFPAIRVCNGGVQGADPVYMLEAYKNVYQQRFSPDLLVVAFNASDINDIVIRGGMNRYILNRPALEHESWLPLYASSLLFRMYMQTVRKVDADLLIPESMKGPLMYDAYTQLFETLMAIRQYEALRGRKVLFVYTPIRLDILNGFAALRDIIDEGKAQGMYMLDATNIFLERGVNAGNLDEYFWPKDSHNTEKGYALIAEAVAQYLIGNQLLGKDQ